jgi:hypothetical protein
MDKLNTPIPSNGFPINWNDFRYFLGITPYSNGLYQAMAGILKHYGDNFIVSGCEISGGNVSEGWVLLDGELIKVDAHTATDDYYAKVVTYNSDGNKQTQLGSAVDAYEQNRAESTASSGNLKNDNRLAGSYTGVVNGNYTKSKPNETINISVTDSSSYSIALGSGYEGEECIVLMNIKSGTINVLAATTYTLTTGSATLSLIYINSGWHEKVTVRDATTTDKGIQQNANNSESVSLTSTKKTITPASLSPVLGGLITTVLEIGDWNMDTSNSVLINHGLTYAKIRGISTVTIRDDNDEFRYNLTGQGGVGIEFGSALLNSTHVFLARVPGGVFDGAGYDRTSYNRGWIIINHIP